MKKTIRKFLYQRIEVKDRYIVEENTKHEEVIIEIKLIGSGDTREISSERIVHYIAKKLKGDIL